LFFALTPEDDGGADSTSIGKNDIARALIIGFKNFMSPSKTVTDFKHIFVS